MSKRKIDPTVPAEALMKSQRKTRFVAKVTVYYSGKEGSAKELVRILRKAINNPDIHVEAVDKDINELPF